VSGPQQLCELLTSGGGQEFPYPVSVERARRAVRPSERRSAFRQIETTLVGVQVRTSSRQPPPRIGEQDSLDRHDT
jgi:hypothetical protein